MSKEEISNLSVEEKIYELASSNHMFIDSAAVLILSGMFNSARQMKITDPDTDFFSQESSIQNLTASLVNQLLLSIRNYPEEPETRSYEYGNPMICFYYLQDILYDIYPGYKEDCHKITGNKEMTMEEIQTIAPAALTVIQQFCKAQSLHLENKNLYVAREVLTGISLKAWADECIAGGDERETIEEETQKEYARMLKSYADFDEQLKQQKI